MTFEFIDDITLADIAFRAWGPTLEEVFQAAARATMQVMVEDLESIRRWVVRQVEQEAESAEMLLFDFLQEIIFFKDAESLLLLPEEIHLQGERAMRLDARLSGEEVDIHRHQPRVDVKAVTMHCFALRRKGEGWEAEVVLDV